MCKWQSLGVVLGTSARAIWHANRSNGPFVGRQYRPVLGAQEELVQSPNRKHQGRAWQLPALLVTGMVLSAIAGFLFINQLLIAGFSSNISSIGDDAKSLGSPDAPVTVIVYSDFQCGFCQDFALSSGQQIVDEYVTSGRVRLVFRHFPVLGDDSTRAAVAAEAAARQGVFWPYHDSLFAESRANGSRALANDSLQKLAVGLGINVEVFNAARGDAMLLSRVQEEMAEGRRAGVRATPTIFVNERMIEGAYPYPVFQAAIDDALGRGGR
jgi:protein-disulfide isomerase